MQRMSAPANPKRSRKVEKVSEMQKGVETGQSGAHIKQVSCSSSKMGNLVHSGRKSFFASPAFLQNPIFFLIFDHYVELGIASLQFQFF